MADKFSSADSKISISGANASGGDKRDAKAVLGSMTKDVRQRWVIVGTVGTVALAAVAGIMSSGTNAPRRVAGPPPVQTVDTTPKGLSTQKDWKAQTGADLLELKQQLYASSSQQKELIARMEALRLEVAQVKGSAGIKTTAPTQTKIDFTLPPPPEPPKSLKTPPAGPTGPMGTEQSGSPVSSSGAGGGSFFPVAPQSAPVTTAPEIKRTPARSFIRQKPENQDNAEANAVTQQDMITNERKGFLPAGSFADATLISGVEASTGGTAQSQPQPIVIRIDENAILPNAASYQIKGCHVLASVWGDMSSERVYGRLATLTCVDANKNLVLSEEVEGNLVDSDGKNGIRGKLVDRQGAKLARTLLAGFAQGMASAFGGAQGAVTTSALGTTTRNLIGADAVRSAGYNGASQATNQLAQFYLKQAEATMPVIAVDASRKVSVLFTKSKALKFETTDYYRLAPKATIKVENPG